MTVEVAVFTSATSAWATIVSVSLAVFSAGPLSVVVDDAVTVFVTVPMADDGTLKSIPKLAVWPGIRVPKAHVKSGPLPTLEQLTGRLPRVIPTGHVSVTMTFR